MESRSESSPFQHVRTREKRVLLTEAEERQTDSLLDELRQALSCKVTFSHLVRVLLRVCRDSEDQILRQAGLTTLTRPTNGDEAGLARFERELAGILSEVLFHGDSEDPFEALRLPSRNSSRRPSGRG